MIIEVNRNIYVKKSGDTYVGGGGGLETAAEPNLSII